MLSRKIKVLIFSENHKREGIVADKTKKDSKINIKGFQEH